MWLGPWLKSPPAGGVSTIFNSIILGFFLVIAKPLNHLPPVKKVNDLSLTILLLYFPGITFFTSFPLSTRTYQVVDAVVDALTSQSPRDRYLLGYDARFFFRPITWFPTVVADFILRCLVLRLPAPPGNTSCNTSILIKWQKLAKKPTKTTKK